MRHGAYDRHTVRSTGIRNAVDTTNPRSTLDHRRNCRVLAPRTKGIDGPAPGFAYDMGSCRCDPGGVTEEP